MESEPEFSVALDRLLWQGDADLNAPPASNESRLEVTVVFTHIPGTLWALKRATELARDLNGWIRLLVPQVVPYPLPLTSPPILVEFNERRFRNIASKQPIDTRVEIYLCRDVEVVLTSKLRPKSLVVMGARKSWWPTAEKALARRLRRAGHQVIFVYTELKKPH
jgi:hypothetical protein